MTRHPDSGYRSTTAAGAPSREGMRPRAFLAIASASLLLLSLVLGACGGGARVSEGRPDSDSSLIEQVRAATGDVTTGGGQTGEAADEAMLADTTYYTESGQLLGEALGQLDARMRTAPADSLPALRAEYQRLLELARRNRLRNTDRVPSGSKNGSPRDEYSALDDGDLSITIPSSGLKGLRQSELSPSSGRRSSGARKPAATARTAPKSTERPRVKSPARPAESNGAATAMRARPAAPAAPAPAPVSSQDEARRAEQQMVDGTAAVRAGKYAEGARQLEQAVKSRKLTGERRATAGYAYAFSLEKSGRLSDAAEQYLALSRQGGEPAHRAYIAYCRVLGQLGEKDRARQLVLRFLKEHPDSSQAVDARLLLQRL